MDLILNSTAEGNCFQYSNMLLVLAISRIWPSPFGRLDLHAGARNIPIPNMAYVQHFFCKLCLYLETSARVQVSNMCPTEVY